MALNAHMGPYSLRVQIGTFNYNLRGSSQYDTPDLQPWLIPTVEEDPDSGYSTTGGPRDAPDIFAVGFQELMPLHMGFLGTGSLFSTGNSSSSDEEGGGAAGQVLRDTDTEIRRAVRPHSAVVSGDGLYPPGGGPEGYTLIARENLVGLALFVYARERSGIVGRVREVRTNRAGTGIFNLLGNKGAVGVRVVLEGSPNVQGTGKKDAEQVLTFVCAHLAAHDHNIARRNTDWKNIVRRLVFPPDSVVPLPSLQQNISSEREKPGPVDLDKLKSQYSEKGGSKSKSRPARPLDDREHTLYDSSHLFVFGDLNYRIAVGIPPHPALASSSAGSKSTAPLKKSDVAFKVVMEEWETLAAYDQLSTERLGGRVFHGLTESPLGGAKFGPTYKYKVDKSNKKAQGGKRKSSNSTGAGAARKPKSTLADVGMLSKKRIPGWTDRVLWRSWADGKDELQPKSAGNVDVELYRSIMTYTHSDHKPVTALLRLPALPMNGDSSSSSAPLIVYKPPYMTDASWRTKRALGTLLDRQVGFIWTALITAGAGNLVAGLLELAVVAVVSIWWMQRGSGQGGNDLAYWMGRLGGSP
ncbi:DNase I-like protein [Tilletiaria anomala UBC 951]|uniref:DNase I-like protein n=1 Tax=Tilletiaria anomala (strain ATCC 24038 / CBS 436.72 / UBC 951) TaxID=1037660 RepID=A0A066VZ78_TILAU|nr:DNase I-like protein [Tilletiaria anomala UBC 951]KDN44124.1 DNase I-like protein [Tilletiaria anomala UBC 951]